MDATNVTLPPSSEIGVYSALPKRLGRSIWEYPMVKRDPLRQRPADDLWEMLTPYAAQAMWSYYHAASWHHRVPDTRIILHPAHLVSFYDPSYSSLAANNKLPVRKHGLTDLSSEDVTAFQS